jgi:hypothetical protein
VDHRSGWERGLDGVWRGVLKREALAVLRRSCY